MQQYVAQAEAKMLWFFREESENDRIEMDVLIPVVWVLQPSIRPRPSLGDFMRKILEGYNEWVDHYNEVMYLVQKYEYGIPDDPEDEEENNSM